MAGFSRARLSVGRDSASDGVEGGSSRLERGDEHDDDPEPILPIDPSLPDSMPESVGLSSFRCIGRVTAVIVVPAGMLGWINVVGDSVRCFGFC